MKLLYFPVFLGIVLALLVIVDYELADDSAEVVFLDVGQGDAILLQQGTTQILVDGGKDAVVLEKLGDYMPFWDRTIELVIMSHSHSDHYAGLIDVFDRFTVEKFMWSGAVEEAADFDVLMEMVSEEGEIVLASADTDFRYKDIYLDVLFPFTKDQFLDQQEKNLNNTSIVIKVSGPDQSVLLTGDAEIEVERELIKHNTQLQSDILKAGHHGSKTSSSEDFIKLVAPDKVIFNAGKGNKFNHPAELIVERYRSLGVETLTLFETGDVKMDL